MKLHTGHIVVDRDNPQHIGRVEAIRHGFFAVVKWADTGWTTKVPIGRLELCGDSPRASDGRFKGAVANALRLLPHPSGPNSPR